MTAGRLLRLAGFVVCVGATVACGKKGDPLPPLRPVPARITDLEAVRSTGQVELRFTVPSVNVDGTEPVALDRIDVYARRAAVDAPPLPAGQIAADDHLLTSLPVRRPDPASGEATVSALLPAPGEQASYVDRTIPDDEEVVVSYVVVPVAGTGRGRQGPPSSPAHVPLVALPLPPGELDAAYDASEIRLTWTPAPEPGARYRVFGRSEDGTAWQVLTDEPLAEPVFTAPVAFGAEACFAVQPLHVAGNVTREGERSAPLCLTPVDTYPPPAPATLQLVQEGSAVTLIWSPVQAPDLAGYVVLRSDGPDGALTPLGTGLLSGTTYRDTAVSTGQIYSYAVRAVDSAPAANAGDLSPRQSITVR